MIRCPEPDMSLSGYLFYPAEESGYELAQQYPEIGAWLTRLKAMPRLGRPVRCVAGRENFAEVVRHCKQDERR